MDMIERVARAMWDVRRQKAGLVQIELEEWGDGSIPRFNHIMDEARAAVEAMREPTDEQRNAYYELSHKTEVMFDAHWERAIDAALISDKPKTDVSQGVAAKYD